MFRRLLLSILKSPSTIAIAIAFLLISGIVAIPGLKTDLFPALNFPILNVITELPSFSSLEMERQVTLPIESAAGGVLGVLGVRSTSATGISMVSVEFPWGTDMVMSRQLLVEALSQVRSQLPMGAQPGVENLSAALALIEGYSLQGGKDMVALRDRAVYELKPHLQRITGVYKVIVTGGKVIEYAVHPNPLLLVKFDLTIENLRDSLAANNILATPGVINHFSQELVLHSNGQFSSEAEIRDVVVTLRNGIPIHVGDVAQVSRSFEYERGDTSERGTPAILINVYKQPSYDTAQVAKEISQAIAAFQAQLGKDYSIRNYYDQAELVTSSIGSVKESVWIGAILVVIVLAIFLHSLRTTLIATLAIPVSVVTALIMLRVLGQGMNIMSLGGLAIGTGIIVDDAIVVLENIHRWLSSPELRGTRSTQDTVLEATLEVVRPVVVSTLTNIAIFLPMIFIAGFAGRLFQPVSVTVTFALLGSLVVALSLIPVLAKTWLKAETQHESDWLHRSYAYPLRFALKRPKWILALTLIPIIAVAFSFKHLETEFLPALDEGAVLLQTLMPPGTSLPEAKRVGTELEKWIKEIPGVVTVTRRTGHAPGAEDTDNVNHSDIMVKLVPKSERPVTLTTLINAMKKQTNAISSVQVNYLMPLADKINDALGGVPADIGIDLFGTEIPVLHELADRILKQMKTVSGLIDLRPPSDIPVPSLEITVNKKAIGRLGVTQQSVDDTLQAYSSGLVATTVREVQKQLNVTLHLSQIGTNLDLESIKGLPLKTASGSTVPLEQIADVSFSEIPSEIYHEHLNRKLTLTANLQGRSANDVAAELQKIMNGVHLPSGYSWSFSGKYKTEQNSLGNMAAILLFAISLVAFILWVEFRSVTQVLLILLTIPLAAIGGFLALWISHETLNVSSMIGAVMLVGIVVRNGIMLLDYQNAEIRSGKTARSAMESAAQKRVRPILMTASVTILGLLPIALGWGTGSELLRPLAITVIGGLLTSTLLTLVVLPSLVAIRKTKDS